MASRLVASLDPLVELIVEGPRRILYAYRRSDTRVQVNIFLNGLEVAAAARYGLRFRQMADQGQLPAKFWHPWFNKTHKDDELKELSVFKDNGSKTRIVTFTEGTPGVMVLLFGFDGKKENDVDRVHINEGKRLKAEYLLRKHEILSGNQGSRRR